MVKKGEAEEAIRHLCHEWAKECGIPREPVDQPSFSAFTSWLGTKGYSHYLRFRSVRGASRDAEDWFDKEFKQTWRN